MNTGRSGKSHISGLLSIAVAAGAAAVGLWWFMNRNAEVVPESAIYHDEPSIGPATNAAPAPVAAAKPEPEPEPEPPAPDPNAPKPPIDSPLVAYYHFDEKDGAHFAADSTGNGRHGRLNDGAKAGSSGQIKAAVNFSRDRGGQITVSSPLDLNTNTVTFAAWLRRRGTQLENTALVYGRGGDTEAGLLLGANGELKYVWNHDTRRGGWGSGLIVPDGVWVFAALAVEAGKATFYLGQPEQEMAVAENKIDHTPAEFSGALTIGRDPILGASFNGLIDEVGVWRRALGRPELEALFKAGQQFAHAATPAPAPTPAVPEAKPATAASKGWQDADYKRAVSIYQDSLNEFYTYMRTRQNPAVLEKIEDNLHKCVDVLEACRSRAPANIDLDEQIGRVNKLIFDVHATKRVR